MANYGKFNAMGNKYMGILEQANDLYRSASQKHLELFCLLRGDGVKFKDIKLHLVNQAKSCHLYRKDVYDAKTGQMVYRPWNEIKHLSWVHQINLFMTYVDRNWESYEKAKVKKSKQLKKQAKIVQPVVIRKEVKEVPLSAPPKTAPSVKKVAETPAPEIVNTKDLTLEKPAPKKDPITAPISKEMELTTVQKQAIVLGNLEILGQKAIELGAGQQFNALMLAMGLEDEVILFD